MGAEDFKEAQEEFIETATFLMNEYGLSKEDLVELLERMDVKYEPDYDPIEGIDF